MRQALYIGLSLAVVAGCFFTGLLNLSRITHPAWQENAAFFGGLAGAVLAGGLFWACAARARLGRLLERVVWLVFGVALVLALTNAHNFIAAETYDAVAVGRWHKASYTVIITFVPGFAALLSKLENLKKGQGA